MIRKFQIFLIIMLLVTFSGDLLIAQSNDALPIGVETYLISKNSDYKQYGLDKLENLPVYNTESLTEFHMPIVYKIPLSAKIDINKFLNQGTFLNTNENFTDRFLDSGYTVYGNLKSDEYFVVDYWLKTKASDKPFSVDFIPKIDIDNTKYDLSQFAWWDSSWTKMKQITINHDYIDSALTDFPILVHIDNTTVLDSCQASGQDIRFVTLDNTILYNHEIESWSSTHAYNWVNVTSISSGTNTTINMYYGNSGASDGQNVTGVWDSNFLMVQHLHNTGGDTPTMVDSTSNDNDMTTYNTESVDFGVSGKINSCFAPDGIDESAQKSGFSLDGKTEGMTELWFKTSEETQRMYMLSMPDVVDAVNGFDIYIQGGTNDDSILCCVNGLTSGGIELSSLQSVWNNNWHYVVAKYESGVGAELYYDGVSVDTDIPIGVIDCDVLETNLACFNSGLVYFIGLVDETRVSDIARNSAWIKACYHSQNQTTGFLSFGAELTDMECPTISYSNVTPPHGSTTVSHLISNLSLTINISDGSNFNYTIECSNGNTTSANGVSNGSYMLNVSNLEPETLYYWYVNSTHNITCGWKNETYNFTTKSSGCDCIDELTAILDELKKVNSNLEGDNVISIDTTQFVIIIQLFLLCVFLWIGYSIPAMEGTKKSLHYMPFSGGLFIIFGGFDFISFAVLLTYNYELGIVGGFLTTVGIILLFYGILKAFYYDLN